MWGYHIKYGRLSADVMLSQRMRRSVSSLDTQRFNTWNAGFQYMERIVLVFGNPAETYILSHSSPSCTGILASFVVFTAL